MNKISKLINLRKVAKANKHITTERILYKEAINCPNWETVMYSYLDVW